MISTDLSISISELSKLYCVYGYERKCPFWSVLNWSLVKQKIDSLYSSRVSVEHCSYNCSTCDNVSNYTWSETGRRHVAGRARFRLGTSVDASSRGGIFRSLLGHPYCWRLCHVFSYGSWKSIPRNRFWNFLGIWLNIFNFSQLNTRILLQMSAISFLKLSLEGHSIGYMKVWLLSNYMLPNPPKVCMPLLRLEFPFLWKDKIDGRAKRAVRNQTLPLLLSSVRGHTRGITSLQIISSARMIVRYTELVRHYRLIQMHISLLKN